MYLQGFVVSHQIKISTGFGVHNLFYNYILLAICILNQFTSTKPPNAFVA